MTQTVFSQEVQQYLQEHYPFFLNNIQYHQDNSFDCFLMNPTGKSSVWISTENMEITLGMDDPAHTSGTHTHLSFYGPELEQQTQVLSEYLQAIFTNKLVFTHSNLSGYSWSEDIVSTILKKDKNEIIEYFTWSEEG